MCSLGSMNHYYNHFFSTLWFLYLSTFSPCLLPDSVYLSKIQLWLNSAPEPLNVSGDNHRSGRPALTFSSRSPVKAVQVTQSYPTRWDPTDYTVHGILQARILDGVGSLSLLQGIFSTQESNPGLLHFRQILYQLSHKGSQRILEWVAFPFSRGSSQPRNRTGVSCTAGRFFTNWATREAET